VPPAWVPAAIVAEGRKARENLRGESSWEFFASGGPYILGINIAQDVIPLHRSASGSDCCAWLRSHSQPFSPGRWIL